MIKINGGQVSISRGDTAALLLSFEGDVPEDGVIALTTLKKGKQDKTAVWEKRLAVTEGNAQLLLEQEDTALPPGVYWWDVRLLDQSSVVTPLPPQMMVILEAVGDV